MSNIAQTAYGTFVQEYIHACDTILKIGQLSDAESLALQQMMDRLSDEFQRRQAVMTEDERPA